MVEDHTAFARALELVLERSDGLEVVALARTLAEGREALRGGGRFDLAVVDLLLPDGDGARLVGEIRERSPGTPVAILSARADVAEAARGAGADAAIHKGAPLARVVSRLEGLAGG